MLLAKDGIPIASATGHGPDGLTPEAKGAVYDLVGVNAEKNVIDRIIAYLKNHGGKATRREIMATIKIKSSDFSEYLATMEESGTVETKIVKRGGKGRDTLYVFFLTSQRTDISSANVSNVSIVEEIPAENVKGKESTLDTLATLDTLDTKATMLRSAAGRSALDIPIRGRKSAEG